MNEVETRLDRIERILAEQVQMARDDRAAYIAWKRDMESQVQSTWMAIARAESAVARMAEDNARGIAELRAEIRQTDEHLRTLGEATDERIGRLVSAIGELIKRGTGND